jgi:DNA-binding PadR family transcriptional regulator
MGDGYLTFSATAILQAVAGGYGYGFDIMDATGLPSGTVYPALRRMEESGLVKSRWEDAAVAQREQRPPRKYYELSRAGHVALADAARRYKLVERPHLKVGKPATSRR